MDKELIGYRKDLLKTIQKLNESYDKLILTLAGGSLALSLTFLKDVIKQDQIISPFFLIAAWFLFIFSLTSILVSILFGIKANKKAVLQVDAGKIYDEKPGGIYSNITTWLHYLGTIFLITGFIFIILFTYLNMEGKNAKEKTTDNAATARTTAITTSSRTGQKR